MGWVSFRFQNLFLYTLTHIFLLLGDQLRLRKNILLSLSPFYLLPKFFRPALNGFAGGPFVGRRLGGNYSGFRIYSGTADPHFSDVWGTIQVAENISAFADPFLPFFNPQNAGCKSRQPKGRGERPHKVTNRLTFTKGWGDFLPLPTSYAFVEGHQTVDQQHKGWGFFSPSYVFWCLR